MFGGWEWDEVGGGVNVWHVFVKKTIRIYILAVSSLYSCRTEVCIIIGSR